MKTNHENNQDRDLLAKADRDLFRRDLYYRVAGSILHVPSLRRRREDIAPLVEHFLGRFAGDDGGKSISGVTVKALRTLESYTWPGNVRELEHEMKRLAYLCADRQAVDSTMLAPRLLRSELPEPEPETVSLRLEDHVRQAERSTIRRALERAGGSQRKAARLLEISRNTLARKIQRLGIDAPKPKPLA